ncbi:MAG: FecR domain-containing protein [Oscillibacter sp.]|nr:FecR domain-containing protein [Oscillibacter sp.]
MKPVKNKNTWKFLLLLLILSLLVVSCGKQDNPKESTLSDNTEEEPVIEPVIEAEATTMSLMKTAGTVGISDGDGKNIIPFEKMKLYSGYHLETQPVSYAWINLDSVKLAKMDENSEIGIRKEGKDLTIFLDAGGLYFNISEPLPEDETMSIRTSTMIVGIRGTCGWVQLLDPNHMQIHLLEGTVECQVTDSAGEMETVTVSGGEMADLIVNGEGEAEITVLPFAENYIAPFVLEELEADQKLCETILEVSGLDILDPPDPVERLREEYMDLIAGRPLYSIVSPVGLHYAEYVDFQGDSIPELLLISDTGLEVYGDMQGHISKYGDMFFPEDNYAYNTISLVNEGSNNIAVEWYGETGWAVRGHTYYALENMKFSAVDEVIVYPSPDGEEGIPEIFTFDGVAITADQGDAIESKYTDYQEIAWFGIRDDTFQVGTRERGILPDLPLDVQRRVALTEVLVNSDSIYAKLIDFDQDGTDELLTLNKIGQYGAYRWTAYQWDGTALQNIPLICDAAEGITTDEMYVASTGIYREIKTGKLYVHYDGEAVGGAFSDYFVSLTDHIVIPQPFDGFIDSQEMWEEWKPYLEQQEAEYQAEMSRFEPLEEIDLYEGSDYSAAIEAVKQRLLER